MKRLGVLVNSKPYAEVTEDEFVAGQTVSYMGFDGSPTTAQFRRDRKRGVYYLDCRSSRARVRPTVSEGVARVFFRSLAWNPASTRLAPIQPVVQVLHERTGSPSTTGCAYRQALHEWQRTFFAERLAEHKWNVAETARALGLSRVGLSKRLRAIGLRRKPKPSVPKRKTTSKRAVAT